MKWFTTVWAVAFMACIASAESPTFEKDPNPPVYQTGAVKPLTAEQKRLDAEFTEKSEKEGWTFNYDVRQIGKYQLGLRKGLLTGSTLVGESLAPIGGEADLRGIELETEFGVTLPHTKNQAQCGSCVYFATTWAFEALNALYKNPVPELSPKHLMNCGGSGWQCGGAFASGDSGVAAALTELGGLCAESDYPYRQPYQGSCKVPQGTKIYGAIKGFKEISPTPRDALAWFHKRTPVLVTVGANGPFQAYQSGIYNACSQTSTNHEVVAIGLECETSKNPDGTCKFDAAGNLPPGVGYWTIQNSWSDEYGENGQIRIKVTDKSGRKCNRIAEEMVILDSGLELPPVGPVEFVLNASSTKLRVVVDPGEITAERAKESLVAAGF